ncbi:MAG: thiamine pyrophosphate-dependent dehydrogenase E1 component subunit alpha, partial [Rubrobacter sp.]
AELLCKVSGDCHGKGVSVHIADVGSVMLGASGIVAGSMGLVCGAAWAFKQRKEDRVAVCFFGDGAVQEGMFSEALNMAAVWQLPVVFVCENNQYAMSLSVNRGFANARISEKADGYGMPGVTVDGMELVEVQEVAREAVDRARSGGGPALIEANTYRYLGHSKSDANLYRTRDEIKQWREKDPIGRFVEHLEKTGDLEAGGLKAVEERVYAEVAEAFDWAMNEPEPEPESALEDVYA